MGCSTANVSARVSVYQASKVCPDAGQDTPFCKTEGQFHQSYCVEQKLGAGAFAQVYAVRAASPGDDADDSEDDAPLAVKVINMHVASQNTHAKVNTIRAVVAQEVDVLRRVSMWSSCLQLYDAFLNGNVSYLVMERCDHTLTAELRSLGYSITERAIMEILGKMLTAIVCIHAVDVVHRDIKPDNFMIKDGCIKLCDFGMAEVLDKKNPTTSGGVMGTAPYMSPEMLQGKPYDTKTDVWSFAAMAHVLLLGKFPYVASTPTSKAMKAAIVKGEPAPDFMAVKGLPEVSPLVKQGLRQILIRDQCGRPSAIDALKTIHGVKLTLDQDGGTWSWSTQSFYPVLKSALRSGAFGLPKLEDNTQVDLHVKEMQAVFRNGGGPGAELAPAMWAAPQVVDPARPPTVRVH